METERRRLLRGLTSTAAAAWLGPVAGLAGAGEPPTPASEPRWLAARRRGAGFEAAVFDAGGRDRHVVRLPDRGHSFAFDPVSGRVVAFGRQPGFFAIAFDLGGRGEVQPLALPDDRHFFGHGVFADGGRLLVATENDFEAGRGVLGVYDASPGGGWRRVGEMATAGIGPHEVVTLSDGVLVVANGGILTHPDYGKMELNLDSMEPSLAYLDPRSGEVLEVVRLAPELHRLSIRHLVVDAHDRVWFGCQYSGPAGDMPPLVGSHRRGEAPRLLTPGDEILRAMRNYVGSVSIDTAGRVVATSSPVGGLVVYWDVDTARCLGSSALADGCGVAPLGPAEFLLSSGEGVMVAAGPGRAVQAILPADHELAWDNHMRRVVRSV